MARALALRPPLPRRARDGRPPRRPAQVSSAARVRAARRGPLHRGLGPAAGQRALRGPRQGALRVCARRRKRRRRELRRGGGGGGGDGGAAGRPAAARHARGGRSRALERAAAGARAAVVALARGGRWTRSRRPGASVAHAIALATECGGGRVGRAGSQGGQGLPAGGVARAPVRALPRDEGGGGRGRRLGPSAARRASADAAAAGPSSGGGGGVALCELLQLALQDDVLRREPRARRRRLQVLRPGAAGGRLDGVDAIRRPARAGRAAGGPGGGPEGAGSTADALAGRVALGRRRGGRGGGGHGGRRGRDAAGGLDRRFSDKRLTIG
mmetsp:Transcript_49203/g.159002  ORF Transcript_49203/g.159002 Transcript_49203/m.159002 type:complete len:328 (+) Transcript_49203:418-1401(+)